MTEAAGTLGEASLSAGQGAGRLLREARERQGLHIAVLASMIKVSPRKLEALEAGRFEELPDTTFTRALAQTVCRALKIDAGPVLAQLPEGTHSRLEQVSSGLNTPFRERPGGTAVLPRLASGPLLWAGAALLAGALALALLPLEPLQRLRDTLVGGASTPSENLSTAEVAHRPAEGTMAAPAASAGLPDVVTAPSGPASAVPGVALASAGTPVTMPAAVAPVDAASGAAALQATPAAAGVMPPAAPEPERANTPPAAAGGRGVLLSTTEAAWVEITDDRGRRLIRREVTPAEPLTLDPGGAMRLKIGNASAVTLSYHGEAVDLQTYTRNNVARVRLE